MKKCFLGICALVLVTAVSCSNGSVPVSTIYWEESSDNFIQFSTNDEADCGYGYRVWDSVVYNPMTYFEGNLKKMSGASWYGYGFIFCVQDGNNFYRVLIDATGYYIISKRVSGSYATIIDWTASSNLHTGYNVVNKIRVTKTGDNTFALAINDVAEATFTDTQFDGGMYGFYASVGDTSDENFPRTPADMRFQLTYPSAIP